MNWKGKADILFYFPGDDNWWLGSIGTNNQLNWTLVGNTKGFGHGINDGRPFWIGNFSSFNNAAHEFYYYYNVQAKMVSYEEVYAKLHNSILSRHFALNRYFRTNFLSVDSNLSTAYDLGTLLSKDHATQLIERWKIDSRFDDNPLMHSGLLLTCLAVESYLGSTYALEILKKALVAISTLYKFAGNNFDGYILRGDPITRDDKWEMQQGKKLYSQRFLIDKNNNYLYCAPSNDPRYSEYKSDDLWDNWAMYYRHNEVSTDELAGLVAGYSIIYQLVKDPTVQSLVKDQVTKLADYLNAHGYILVRPYGGFSLRGASGVTPVFEYPFNRFFSKVTGISYSAEVIFEDAMDKAKMWPCLEGPTNWANILAAPLIEARVILDPLISYLGLSDLLASLDGIKLARAIAIISAQVCFDADERGEFAAAYIAKQIPDKAGLFKIWMNGIKGVPGASGSKGTNWAVGFVPFICLTALGDNDDVVKNAFLDWLNIRQEYNQSHPAEGDLLNTGAKSCFALAIALLFSGGSKDLETAFVSLLNKQYAEFRTKYSDDLPLNLSNGKIAESVNATPKNDEPYIPSALDYMAGLALSWLYTKRQAEKGTPVTTDGFPKLPSNLDPLLKVVIPKEIWPYYGTNNIEFRIQDIQNTLQIDTSKDADLFADTSPEKSEIPSPQLPSSPNTSLPPQIDIMVRAREKDKDVNTGITLRNGDIYEFSEVSGSIRAGVALTGWNGPDGWDNVGYNVKFPLHGGLDPINAHPYCLLGKLKNYFFIGSKGRQEQFIYSTNPDLMPAEGIRLYVRINDDTPGNGDGEFLCRIKVWSTWPLLNTGWSPWQPLAGLSIASDPTAIVNDDSTIEVFVKGSNNQLYHIWQTSPHGAWSGWESLGGILTSNISVIKNAYHGLEAFVKGNDNQLYHIAQNKQHGDWMGWQPLAGLSIASDPTAIVNDDSTIEVFVKGSNNQLYHIWQTSPHGAWSGWESLGGILTSNISVIKNAYHGLEAFVKGNDNQLYHMWQGKQHGDWSFMTSLGGTILSNSNAVVNDGINLYAFVKGADGTLYYTGYPS